MNQEFATFLKGAAMGAANVIPGVSGGTVAFITGIYERLINAIKSIDSAAIKLLLGGKFREFAKKTDFRFLFFLGLGVVISILSLAKLLDFLFLNHEVHVWAFFFGLILASVYFVGKQVGRWSTAAIAGLVVGAGIAIGVALMNPTSENDNIFYLLLCGVVAMASMIIPGLSGSFVLLLMGNYQLIMIESVSKLTDGDLSVVRILVPVAVGAVIGLIALSRLLAWIFEKYHDLAVALLTGFVAGSLLSIWPWKEAIISKFSADGVVKEKVIGYDWGLPGPTPETGLALLIMVAGFFVVWMMEKTGAVHPEDSAPAHSATTETD